MGRGQTSDTIEEQCRARDEATDSDDVSQAVAMEIVLGGHLLAAGAAAQAESSHTRAVAIAKQSGEVELSAVALFALGSSRMAREGQAIRARGLR